MGLPNTSGWDGSERRSVGDIGQVAGPLVEWLTRLENEIIEVRSSLQFIKRAGAVSFVLLTIVTGYFVWVTRNTLISERELPRLEAQIEAHTLVGGHNGTNEQLAAIAVELRYLRDDVTRLKTALDDARDRARGGNSR